MNEYLEGIWRNKRTGNIYKRVYVTNGIATCTTQSGSSYLTQVHNIERADIMRAKLTYGPFTHYMDIKRSNVNQYIRIPKPLPLIGASYAVPPGATKADTSKVEPSTLEFMLKRSPRIGEVLEYEYVGEA